MAQKEKLLFSISELRPFLYVAGYGCLSAKLVGVSFLPRDIFNVIVVLRLAVDLVEKRKSDAEN